MMANNHLAVTAVIDEDRTYVRILDAEGKE